MESQPKNPELKKNPESCIINFMISLSLGPGKRTINENVQSPVDLRNRDKIQCHTCTFLRLR